MKHAAILILLLFKSSIVFAFGPTGHKAVAYQCEAMLSVKAKAQIKAILGNDSLADMSVWPDKMRGSTTRKQFWRATGSWHYVNVPKGRGYSSVQHQSQADIVKAITVFSQVLAGKPIQSGAVKQNLTRYFGDLNQASNQQQLRKFAVSFLIHLIADLHQPLHTGYKADLGGNRVMVKWFGEQQNIHRIWDSSLLQKQNLSARQLANKLLKLSPADKTRYQQSSLQDWVAESLQLRYRIYDVDKYNRSFNANYVNEFTPVVNQQMQKAAVRAAALFNRLLK